MSQALLTSGLCSVCNIKIQTDGSFIFLLKHFFDVIFLKTLLNLLRYCFCLILPWGMGFSSPTRDWTSTTYAGGRSSATGLPENPKKLHFWTEHIHFPLWIVNVRTSQATISRFKSPLCDFSRSSRAEVNSCIKTKQQPLEFSVAWADFGISPLKFLKTQTLSHATGENFVPQRPSHVPFKHNGNWAIELGTYFSKGSSSMWQLCHGQQ